MKAKILKKLAGSNGDVFNIGDVVDVSNWRNTKALISGRYISMIKDEPNEVQFVSKEEVTEETPKPRKPRTKKTSAVK